MQGILGSLLASDFQPCMTILVHVELARIQHLNSRTLLRWLSSTVQYFLGNQEVEGLDPEIIHFFRCRNCFLGLLFSLPIFRLESHKMEAEPLSLKYWDSGGSEHHVKFRDSSFRQAKPIKHNIQQHHLFADVAIHHLRLNFTQTGTLKTKRITV